MILLAFDTSAQIGGVALWKDDSLLYEEVLREGLRHGAALMPALERCLEETGTARSDLSAIAVGTGPGSYTGTRIGVMAAKAVAYGLQIPILGISSLAAVAGAAGDLSPRIVPIMDARKEEVYVGAYEGGAEVCADVAVRPEQALTLIEQAPCAIVGSAVTRDPDWWRERCGEETTLSTDFPAPLAGTIARLAALRLADGHGEDPLTLQPVYLRREDSPAPFALQKKKTP